MTNLYKELITKCAEVGSNLSEVCKDAGVTRMTVQAWKRKEPKTITILRKLEAEIAKKKELNVINNPDTEVIGHA